MATTAVPDNNLRNGFVVVTQLVPTVASGQNAVGAGPGVSTVGVPVVTPVNNINTVISAPDSLQKFLKSQPQALGTVQIMIGIITFLFGIVLTVVEPTISVYSGVVYWSPLFYIITGSLTIAAEKKLNACLVKGSLGMNVVSIIIAATAFILLLMDLLVYQYDPCYNYYECEIYNRLLQTRTYGISGVLLVLSLLQLIISIFISAFGCKATCCTEPVVSVVTVAPNYAACCSRVNPFQTHSGQQDVLYIQNSGVTVNNPPTENPPAYSVTLPKPEACA
ncbi:membrane-spanning 4-domains subfamily A member 4A-like isoform X1 [Pygocentrus nattereri]|uniref:membrane-spanning 4-domains subfamily A member 4A-like isoform X1 n=1 Tax=Pygocentrus nattereri TaxID=42514 RepID=UPI0018914467|nr:membrane-spanning 4-domains subfamily A member 4A-like isoform X1 [Pygocentrus nattereri]